MSILDNGEELKGLRTKRLATGSKVSVREGGEYAILVYLLRSVGRCHTCRQRGHVGPKYEVGRQANCDGRNILTDIGVIQSLG